jgi:DNA-damage-inducible protein J
MTENSLPSEPEIPNATTAAAIQEARPGELPTFTSVSDLMADLNSED